MASRFEQVTDVDRMVALRRAGLLYWRRYEYEDPVPLVVTRISREEQENNASHYMYYVIVEDDCEQSL